MFGRHDQAVYDLLGAHGLLSWEQLEAARERVSAAGGMGTLAEQLVADGALTQEVLEERLAAYAGCELWRGTREEWGGRPASGSLLEHGVVPPGLARAYGVVPLQVGETRVELLTSDPFDLQAMDDLAFALNREVRFVVASEPEMERCWQGYAAGAGLGSNPPDSASVVTEVMADEAETDPSAKDLERLAAQAPVVRLVHDVLAEAVRLRASDVHFEPFEDRFTIRYRVDGALREWPAPPRRLALPAISRLKVMANLNIAERRLPQDGRIRLTVAERTVDLRLSTLPTQSGESAVLRVLDATALNVGLDKLGLPPALEQELRSVIRRPNGILLVTGPTGSGKTTTLYGALRELNRAELKLLTVEDPVEYEIDGVMQVPVNPMAGLTFPAALRSFLRQDPDVVMVGEIRDLETTQIALRAAVTGHLVLSTLHTSEAAGAVARLMGLGAEPFLLAAALQGVLAQRLLRRICRDCRTAERPSPEMMSALGLDPTGGEAPQFFHGAGCEHCGHTGYRGRVGLFEWLRVTEAMRELIGQGASQTQLRELSVRQGMRTLREEGLQLAREGLTTLEEVVRYT
jgi:type IV pilus assembly protein PilB